MCANCVSKWRICGHFNGRPLQLVIAFASGAVCLLAFCTRDTQTQAKRRRQPTVTQTSD